MSDTNSDDPLSPNRTDPLAGSDEEVWTDAGEAARAEELAKEGDKILRRLEGAQKRGWKDWMALAVILARISKAAERLSGANSRAGRPYNEAFSRLLHDHNLGDKRWKQTRAALLNIHTHRAEVEAMRERWDHDQRLKASAPATVWAKFQQRSFADDPSRRPAPPPRMPARGEEVRYSFAHLDNEEIVAVLVQDVRAPDRLDAIGRSLIEQAAVLRPRSRPAPDDGWPVEATPAPATTPDATTAPATTPDDDDAEFPEPPPDPPEEVARKRAYWLDVGARLLAVRAQHPDGSSEAFATTASEHLGRVLGVMDVRAAMWWAHLTNAQRDELNGLAPHDSWPVAMQKVCREHRRHWL
jgi:hypothetical protein